MAGRIYGISGLIWGAVAPKDLTPPVGLVAGTFFIVRVCLAMPAWLVGKISRLFMTKEEIAAINKKLADLGF